MLRPKHYWFCSFDLIVHDTQSDIGSQVQGVASNLGAVHLDVPSRHLSPWQLHVSSALPARHLGTQVPNDPRSGPAPAESNCPS